MRLFVKLQCQISTLILSVIIKYSMRHLIVDVHYNVNVTVCEPRVRDTAIVSNSVLETDKGDKKTNRQIQRRMCKCCCVQPSFSQETILKTKIQTDTTNIFCT